MNRNKVGKSTRTVFTDATSLRSKRFRGVGEPKGIFDVFPARKMNTDPSFAYENACDVGSPITR